MTHGSFEFDTFSQNVERLFAEFAREHHTHFTVWGEYRSQHTIKDADVKYTLEYRKNIKKLAFSYQSSGGHKMHGTLDFKSRKLSREGYDPSWHLRLVREDQEYIWECLVKIVETHFSIHAEELETHLTKPVIQPTWNVSGSDIREALEKSFNDYSTTLGKVDTKGMQTLCTVHNHISVSLAYTEESGVPTTLKLILAYTLENFTEEIFMIDYSFKNNSGGEKGSKPDGFNEGFAKFKLLASLMN